MTLNEVLLAAATITGEPQDLESVSWSVSCFIADEISELSSRELAEFIQGGSSALNMEAGLLFELESRVWIDPRGEDTQTLEDFLKAVYGK